jgi:hypothetical protein
VLAQFELTEPLQQRSSTAHGERSAGKTFQTFRSRNSLDSPRSVGKCVLIEPLIVSPESPFLESFVPAYPPISTIICGAFRAASAKFNPTRCGGSRLRAPRP